MRPCAVSSGPDQHRFVFVGGLPRSGTTLLAQAIARYRGVSELHDTGVAADEGQYLQHIYPRQPDAGGSAKFAYSSEMHITERSPLVTEASRAALWEAWSPYWDTDNTFLLEKTPANLLKMRFLQALFPTSSFVVIIRHPVAETMALKARGWSRRPVLMLVHHWLTAHKLMMGDLPSLDRVVVVRYEDVVADPHEALEDIQSFLGLDSESPGEDFLQGLNDTYYQEWEEGGLWTKLVNRITMILFESRIRRYGYSFRSARPIGPMAPELPTPRKPGARGH
jgi:hypothetical protein